MMQSEAGLPAGRPEASRSISRRPARAVSVDREWVMRDVGITRPALAGLLALLILPVGCAGEADGGTPAKTPYDLPDPARVDALSDTYDSVYSLAEEILQAIHDGDQQRLMQLRVGRGEFRWLVWPKLPASRPERNLPWAFVYTDLDQKSLNAMRRTVSRYQGKTLQLVRVEFKDETTDYGAYKVHRDARCVVQDETGEVTTLDLFGSVIEMNGRFKAFSYVVD